jgi:hypothetical protein
MFGERNKLLNKKKLIIDEEKRETSDNFSFF